MPEIISLRHREGFVNLAAHLTTAQISRKSEIAQNDVDVKKPDSSISTQKKKCLEGAGSASNSFEEREVDEKQI